MRSETLEWVIGVLCALLGALVLVAPHRFAAPASPLGSGWGSMWGAVAVVAGLALLSAAVLRPRRSLRVAAHALAGGALLALAVAFAADGIWVATVAYVLLGLGTAAAGALALAPPGARAPDAFALLMGAVAVLNGLVLLLWPDLSSSAYFDEARATLPALGAWLLGGGALLVWAQLGGRRVPAVLGRSAHLIAGGAFLALGAVVSLPRHAWTAVAVNWIYGAVLAALPWISRRLAGGGTSSLRARLALVMAGVTSLALVATVALATWQDERFARRIVAEERQDEAEAIAMRLSTSDTLRAARADGYFSPVEAEIIAHQIARPGLAVWLVGERGRVLARAAQEGWPELPEALRRDLLGRKGPEEGERLLGAARVPEREWTVITEGDRERELAGSRRARDTGLVLLLLFLPVTIAAGTLLAARVTRPLTALGGAVTAMAEGQPGHPLEPSGVTEVARLAATFATLRDRLAERTAEGERLAAELRARAEALGESDRRKDEFLAMLGHELRNPLGAISTSTAVVAELAGGDKRLARAIAITRRQVEHLSRLVDDLLDVSRISRGSVTLRRELVDLRDALAAAVEASGTLFAGKEQELLVETPPEPLWVVADPTRLEQVIVNLLRNAAKYTPPGGHVLARVASEGDAAVLVVRDDGVGIAPELLPRVFDMFFQADQGLERTAGGLGIGLTLVRRLVELHGGRCEARSAGPGEGTEVEVRLPLASREAAAGAAVAAGGGRRAETAAEKAS